MTPPILSHLILLTGSWNRNNYHPQFTDEETEAENVRKLSIVLLVWSVWFIFVLKDLGFHISSFSKFLILSFSCSVESILKSQVVKEIMYFRQRTKIESRLYMLYILMIISIILKSAHLYYLTF